MMGGGPKNKQQQVSKFSKHKQGKITPGQHRQDGGRRGQITPGPHHELGLQKLEYVLNGSSWFKGEAKHFVGNFSKGSPKFSLQPPC